MFSYEGNNEECHQRTCSVNYGTSALWGSTKLKKKNHKIMLYDNIAFSHKSWQLILTSVLWVTRNCSSSFIDEETGTVVYVFAWGSELHGWGRREWRHWKGRDRGGWRGGERPAGQATHLHLCLILSTPFIIKKLYFFLKCLVLLKSWQIEGVVLPDVQT